MPTPIQGSLIGMVFRTIEPRDAIAASVVAQFHGNFEGWLVLRAEIAAHLAERHLYEAAMFIQMHMRGSQVIWFPPGSREVVDPRKAFH